jgi:hypothetical protein
VSRPGFLFSRWVHWRTHGNRRSVATLSNYLMIKRAFYSSENGDRWFLINDPEAGRVFVRHQANLPSGGAVTDSEICDFLGSGRTGPQHVELLRLIGSLAKPGIPR